MVTKLTLRCCSGCVIAVASMVTPAQAEDADVTTAEARRAFVEGARHVEEARWAEALDRFEESARLRPHAVTSYNVAACHRALGAYTQARRRYAEALRLSDAEPAGAPLPAPVRSEIEGLLGQLDGVVAHVDVTLTPAHALLSVDGRPLLFGSEHSAVAGLRNPGGAEPVAVEHFSVELDPGVHTFTVRREGYADVVSTISPGPGSRSKLALHLDRLPSTLHIASLPTESVVRVDGLDVGTSPITVTRPAGTHRVAILRPGFTPYDVQVSTHPGEALRITGKLSPEVIPLTKRWWFWAGLSAAVIGAGFVTYAGVRSTETPAQAPFDGGTLGWTVPAGR